VTQPYADYLPEGTSGPSEPAPPVPEPDPDDEGSVFVNWVSLEENLWSATWQRGEKHRGLDGATRDQALTWARSQKASHYWIFSSEANDWVPLDVTDQAKESE
jgi:hypothetical protein